MKIILPIGFREQDEQFIDQLRNVINPIEKESLGQGATSFQGFVSSVTTALPHVNAVSAQYSPLSWWE